MKVSQLIKILEEFSGDSEVKITTDLVRRNKMNQTKTQLREWKVRKL